MKKPLAAFIIFQLIATLAFTVATEAYDRGFYAAEDEYSLDNPSGLNNLPLSTFVSGAWDVELSKLRGLCDSLGVPYTVDGFSKVIETYFLPLNMRFVGLHMRWSDHANTLYEDIVYDEVIDNWLSACDKYGIFNIFYIRQWGCSYRKWDDDVLAAFPELRNLDPNGNPVPIGGKDNPIALGHPLALEQYKDDLRQIYEYYGHHLSWIGFGGYTGDFAHYGARRSGEIKNSGFHPYQLEEFVESDFFLYDIIGDGYHEDETKCKLWEMYIENEPIIKLASGTIRSFSWSQPLEIYGGKGSGGRCVAFKFKASENLYGFQTSWYGYKQGNPADLVVELYPENGSDFPENLGSPLETVTVQSTEISSSKSWQAQINFSSTLAKGDYYWIVFSAQGDSANKYMIYRNDYRIDDSHCKTSTNGYQGSWSGKGSAALRIKDKDGVDKTVYPYYTSANMVLNAGQKIRQAFTAPSDIEFNAIFLRRTDRADANDPRPCPVKIIRESDNLVLAEGEINVVNFKGTYWWVTVPLDRTVSLQASERYIIEIGPPPTGSIIWQIGKEIADPPEYGFQGQSEYLLFALADLSISKELSNYDHYDYLSNSDPISYTNWVAIGFKPTLSAKLTSIDIKFSAKETGVSDLNVSLYDSEPIVDSKVGSVGKPKSMLESITVSAEEISTGWVTISGWQTTLQSNQTYWIVFSQVSPSSGSYRIYFKTNNYVFPLLYTKDQGKTWGWGFPIVSTPADPIAKITTEKEAFRSEPEDRTFLRISDSEWVAQSFTSSKNVTIRGTLVWLTQGVDGYDKIKVEIRSDNGMGAPSQNIIAQAYIYPGEGIYSTSSMALIDFRFPVNLTAGTKYWLVISSDKNSIAKVLTTFYREPEFSFGGTVSKAKYSTDEGASWFLPNGKEADIVFSMLEATNVGNVYSTSEIAQDILKYHAHSYEDEPLHGWNTYLNFLSTRLTAQLCEWFEAYAGRRFIGIDVNTHAIREKTGLSSYLVAFEKGNVGPLGSPPEDTFFWDDAKKKIVNLLRSWDIIPWSSIGQPLDNLGYITPEQIGLYYRLGVPLLSSQIVSVFDWSSQKLMNATQQEWSIFYGETLNRMRYVGDFYGKEKSTVKALFIGDMDIGITPQFLTPSIDITLEGFEGINGDNNLTKYGNFSQFNIILWLSGRPNMDQITPNAQTRIKNFVANGGGFIAIGPWPNWANEILGFDYTDEGISSGSKTFINYSHPILKPFTDISEYVYYWRNKKIVRIDGEYVVKDSNEMPWIGYKNYGSGKGVFCGITESSPGKIGTWPEKIFGAPRDSYLTLLNNAIFYAAGKEEMIPTWWFENTYRYRHAWHSELRYSINGKTGGPILLWLSNNNQTTSFEIHLNATFYGIDPKGWIAIDVQRWKVVARGSGSDIAINVNVPAESWMPIYIMNSTSNLGEVYSNLKLEKGEVSQSSCNYTISGFYNQTGWLVLNCSETPVNVTTDNAGVIPSASLSTLNSPTAEKGWCFDQESNLLIIKFKTTSSVKVQVILPSEPIDVPDPPIASFTYTPTQPHIDETITFNASESHDPDGFIANYFWDFGDGTTVDTSSAIMTHVYSSFGNYTVTLTIEDDEGLTSSYSKIITITDYPTAEFTYSPAYPIIGETVIFDASASTSRSGTIVSYLWSFGDGNLTTIASPIITHVYTSAGNYTVALTVTDSENLTSTHQTIIAIAEYAQPPPSPEKHQPNIVSLTLMNPSIGKQGCYATQPYTFQAIIEDADGIQNINNVKLILDPNHLNITVQWTQSSNVFAILNNPENCVQLGESKALVANETMLTLNFVIIFKPNFPTGELHAAQIYVSDSDGLCAQEEYTNVYYVAGASQLPNQQLDLWWPMGFALLMMAVTATPLIIIYAKQRERYP